MSASEYYQEYYKRNKSRYKTYYIKKKQQKLQNQILFQSYGGEINYYKNQYIKFISETKNK
jgi:hypothetical protein